MNQPINPQEASNSCTRYYNQVHEQYLSAYTDELSKKPYDEAFLQRFSNMLDEGSPILDVGCCSTAQQARYLRDQGFGVSSIDLSYECIETAKKNFKGINFQQMDMMKMTFEDQSFAGIIAFYSIIHIPNEQTEGLFTDFNRLLDTGGKLAIAVHAGDFYGYYNEGEVPVFYRTYTHKELEHLLKHSGFKLRELDQRNPLYDFEFQSERIYLIAEKV